MERAADARAVARVGFPWRGLVAIALALSPTALLAALLAVPALNPVWSESAQHLVLTTNVSVVALVAGLLVARAALALRQFGTLLLALGFIVMAGIFTVHGLATPGEILKGVDFSSASLVVGVSGQLALLLPAAFFALRYTALTPAMARRVEPRALLGAVAVGLLAYGVLGIGAPELFDGAARVLLTSAGSAAGYDPSGYGYGAPAASGDPFGGAGVLPYLTVGLTVALYGSAAWRQGLEFARTRLPLQGALVVSFLLLAQAQLSQFLGPVYSASWWEYHGLMLAAVALAVGAIFVELDRRRGLERFLPPTVVERVIAGDAQLAGERRVATILFADLRGSTALADRLDPESVVAIVNGYLGAFAASVLETGGIVDKFTGDGLMATFLGPTGDDGAPAAARAALAIRVRVAALNTARAARGEPTLRFGVGIHTGEVVLGAIGLPERSEFTALGDAVNIAARMEALTKEKQVDVVLSVEVARRLEGVATLALGEAHVKGKAQPIEVLTLV